MNLFNILSDCSAGYTNCCSDPGLAVILSITHKVMNIIQIIVPIILMIFVMIGFVRMMVSPDDKKAPKSQFNKIMAAFFIFITPIIIDVTMNLLPDSFSISNCWKAADEMAEDIKNNPYKPYEFDENKKSNVTMIIPRKGNPQGGGSSADVTQVSNANAQKLLEEAKKNWPVLLNPKRIEVILKGAGLVGKIQYSMDYSLRASQADIPIALDCSSFVAWAFQKTGHTNVTWGAATGFYVSNPSIFKRISKNQLAPGDIGLKNSIASGPNNHVGIYVGKDASGNDLWLHCTSSVNGVIINNYSNFEIYYQYTGF